MWILISTVISKLKDFCMSQCKSDNIEEKVKDNLLLHAVHSTNRVIHGFSNSTITDDLE